MASPNEGTITQPLSAIDQTMEGKVHDIGTITQTLPTLNQTIEGKVHDIGIIAQTLPIISQSVTGVSLFETLFSIVNASSILNEFSTEELTSTGIATDASSAVFTDEYADTVNISSTPTFVVITELESTVTATESFLGSSQTTRLPDESPTGAYVRRHILIESIVQSISLLITSTVNASNSFEFGRDFTISDTVIALGNIVSPGVVYTQNVEAIINANNSFVLGLTDIVANVVTANEVITNWAVVAEILISAVDAGEGFTFNSDVFNSLESTAQVNHSFGFGGDTANELLCSIANARGTIWAKDFGAIAWVLNTQSGGITNYNNFGFSSIAFHDGRLYATSPGGLFEFGGDNDDGRIIDSVIKTGFLDFGVEEKKRISDIYIGYTGGDLECDVETYDGPEDVYTYSLEHRAADAPRNSRIKIGRGLSSRYWRLTFRNVGGADFQIYDLAIEMAKSKRRL